MSVMDSLSRHAALSFEVFPPRTDAGMEALCGRDGVIDRLYTLEPDCIFCACGSGGSDAGKSLAVLQKVAGDGRVIGATHLPCAGSTKADIQNLLHAYLEHGIRHVQVLCGDSPLCRAAAGSDLLCTTDLVAWIRREFGSAFTIAVSASPQGNITSRPPEADIASLKQAQDCGADYIITQPCWDMDSFRYWLDAIRAAGIRMPVEVGVLPVLDQAEIISAILSRSGSVMPETLSVLISEHWIYPNPFAKDPFDADAERKKADFRKAGIEYTIRQIRQYRACGADGIHLLTQNQFGDIALITKESGLTSC